MLGEVAVAPMTSTIRQIPSEVVLTPEDGMPKVCAVILKVTKAKVRPLITELNDSQMDQVENALIFALGF